MVKLATPAALLYAALILGLAHRLHQAPGADPGLEGIWLLLASLPAGLLPLMLPLPESRDVFLLAMTSAGLFQALLVWLAGRVFDSPLLQKPGPVIMPPSTRISLPEQ
ncbi:SCO4225 family membrane protein [Actinocorallia populi]|uniref:SCO4225 family membrane protein n=1 Tax=Actinocorallia populi TaxID=2079200 RepID=UPI000D087731|nr:hypothetical protein [Actinocorallia populi]